MKQKPKPSLIATVESFLELVEHYRDLDLDVGVLGPVAEHLQEQMEAIPIVTDGIAKKYIIGFALVGDSWYPVHVLNEIDRQPGEPMHGWALVRTDHDDGSSSSGPVQRYRWAHCTADDTVNYHWLDDVIDAGRDYRVRQAQERDRLIAEWEAEQQDAAAPPG